MMKVLGCAVWAVLSVMGVAQAQDVHQAAQKLEAFLAQIPDVGPGYAVVIVTSDAVVLNHAQGLRRASAGAPLTADTPLYIASQTKAMTGLLAARLDAEGVLSLDSTLADHWPDLVLPGDLDPADWTLAQVFTHQLPIEAEALVMAEAYVTELDAASYPMLISASASLREPGFEYDNIGPNIYGAILEAETGRSWRDWLDEKVYDPLGMSRTSSRTSDYASEDLAWNHVWLGQDEGWLEVAPKTDAIMHSAGGTMTTTTDMAVWLQTFLRGEGPQGSGITSDMVKRAEMSYVETHQEEGRNAYELPCTGYALGWNVCDFKGYEVRIHGGSYTGARSMMAYMPELDAGIAVFANGSKHTGWLTSRTVNMFMQYLSDDPEAERMEALRIEAYPQRVQQELDWYKSRIEQARTNEMWQGWGWSPAHGELDLYTGQYGHDLIPADIRVIETEAGLSLHLGAYVLALEPAAPDLFGGQNTPLDRPEPVRFVRDDTETIIGFDWEGVRFQRLD